MKLCRRDLIPLVFTFEQPGAEYHCMECGGWFAMFDNVSTDTPSDDMVRLADHLVERFRAGVRGPDGVTQPPHARTDIDYESPMLAIQVPDAQRCGRPGCKSRWKSA